MQNKKKSKTPFFERGLNKTVLGQGHFSNKSPGQKKKNIQTIWQMIFKSKPK